MKRIMRHFAELLTNYARSRGWNADQYKLYFDPDAERYRVGIIVVGPFPPDDDEHEEARFEEWNRIVDFLEEHLRDEPSLLHSYDLVLRTPEEVESGDWGYRIRPEYVEASEL